MNEVIPMTCIIRCKKYQFLIEIELLQSIAFIITQQIENCRNIPGNNLEMHQILQKPPIINNLLPHPQCQPIRAPSGFNPQKMLQELQQKQMEYLILIKDLHKENVKLKQMLENTQRHPQLQNQQNCICQPRTMNNNIKAHNRTPSFNSPQKSAQMGKAKSDERFSFGDKWDNVITQNGSEGQNARRTINEQNTLLNNMAVKNQLNLNNIGRTTANSIQHHAKQAHKVFQIVTFRYPTQEHLYINSSHIANNSSNNNLKSCLNDQQNYFNNPFHIQPTQVSRLQKPVELGDADSQCVLQWDTQERVSKEDLWKIKTNKSINKDQSRISDSQPNGRHPQYSIAQDFIIPYQSSEVIQRQNWPSGRKVRYLGNNQQILTNRERPRTGQAQSSMQKMLQNNESLFFSPSTQTIRLNESAVTANNNMILNKNQNEQRETEEQKDRKNVSIIRKRPIINNRVYL